MQCDMKLADFMHARSISPETLRRLLGVRSRTTVGRYLRGEQIPRPDLLKKIEALSDGLVTLTDFEDPNPAECAVLTTDRRGKPIYVFPWDHCDDRLEAAFQAMLDEPQEHHRPSEPITEALRVLGGRGRITKRGKFLLDGRPSDARRVVQAANAVLRRRRKKLIRYPGASDIQ